MTKTVLPIITKRLAALDALPRPAGDPPRIAAILSSGRAAVTAATDDPRLLSPGSSAPFGRFDRLATAYGIPACGVGG